MRTHFTVLASALLVAFMLIAGSAIAAGTSPIVITAGQEKWTPGTAPLPSSVGVSVLEGNPAKRGEYTIRLHLPAGTKFKPHWHDSQERVTVISGTFYVGLGKTFNESKMIALPAGSYGSIPAHVVHYAMAKTDAVIQINGEGPRSMVYVK